MYRFWDALTKPLLDQLKPKVVVEIGSDFGFNTIHLLEYARLTGAILHVVDPNPNFDSADWESIYPETLRFHQAPSLDVLPSIGPADVVLIDGDHNWHTVFHELKSLETAVQEDPVRYPVVLLHDVGWPYDRRDLYYEPSRIPAPHQHQYRKGGLRPGRDDLDPAGGLNAHLFNAVFAGGPRNGVLTAVEDFILEARVEMEFLRIPGINGYGILYPKDVSSHNKGFTEFVSELAGAPSLHRLLADVEALRIEAESASIDRQSSLDHRDEEILERDRRISRLAEEMATEVGALNEEVRRANQEIRKLQEVEVEGRAELAETNLRAKRETFRANVAEKRLRETTQAYNKLLRNYRRLRGRRSVRIALGFAGLFRPLFRWRRRSTGTKTEQTSDSAGHRSATSPRQLDLQVPVVMASVAKPSLTFEVSLDEADDLSTGPQPITIIVPIYNAYEDVRRCIDSLVRNTHYPARLLLIDDASPDTRIADLLQRTSERFGNVRILRNEVNLGFVATANRGFAESQGDVVLLNSDVEVVPGWLRRLVVAARSNPSAATVTPFSNNAGAFSAPVPDEEAQVPPSLSRDEIGRLVARRALRLYPTTPTGNGFCLFIRRKALEEVGFFDEVAFPRGYGEENDFCMRALRAGWTHIVDDTTYLFHGQSASFGEEKTTLMANAKRTIEDRYPDYERLVRDFMSSKAIEAARAAVASAFQATDIGETIRPRLLTVMHTGGGGTPATNLDLMRALAHRYEPYQLVCDTHQLILEKLTNGELKTVGTWPLGIRLDPTETTRRDYRNIVAGILRDLDIEAVHIHHLIGHTFDLPSVAKVFNIPVILSLHDFYYVCPTVHLLDERQQFCGGRCTPGQGVCPIPTGWLDNLPHLKHAWVHNWRDRVAEMFQHVDVFVTPSTSARTLYLSVFPQIEERLHLIEHGRDVTVHNGAKATPPPRQGPVRILVPGNLDVNKGGDLLKAIKELDTEGRLEFHFAGRTRSHYGDLGAHHGEYERHDWFSIVEKIRPSFAGLFSVTAETFSHTLSEAWLAGIPVIATDRGALKDRIERDGGGWLIDPDDPKHAYDQIREIVDDTEGFEAQLKTIPTASLRSAGEMAADYETLYKSVHGSTSPFAPTAARRPIRGPLRLGLFVPGSEYARPASTYVRILQRYFHPALDQAVVPVILNAAAYVETPDRLEIDVALVQRTGVPADLTDRFIEALLERQVPLLLDLDEDLIGIQPEFPDYDRLAAWIDPLRRLASAANAITVSTKHLLESLSHLNPATFLLPNQLDEHLWLSPVSNRDQLLRPSMSDAKSRLLYFGSLAHQDDLEILRSGVQSLRDQVTLTVIGGASPGSLDWCEQIVPERSWMQYPDFVRWLREHASAFDIVVLPVVDTESNRAKSDLRFLEASALGLPVIGSKVEAFSATIKNDQTGLLTANSPVEWTTTIARLHEDHSLRRNLASSAFEYVRDERLLVHHMTESEGLLDALLTGSTG